MNIYDVDILAKRPLGSTEVSPVAEFQVFGFPLVVKVVAPYSCCGVFFNTLYSDCNEPINRLHCDKYWLRYSEATDLVQCLFDGEWSVSLTNNQDVIGRAFDAIDRYMAHREDILSLDTAFRNGEVAPDLLTPYLRMILLGV